jgi:hypothetical protein
VKTNARVFAAICAWLAVVVLSSAQSASTGPLSAQLRNHLQTESLQIVSTIRGLPLGVREKLQALWGSGLDIANPGIEFRGTKTATDSSLPTRRLIAAGCASDNHCLVYYERAGTPITQRAMLFAWTPDETKFLWGGVAPAGFTNIDDVRKAAVSGAIKGGEAGPW